MRWDEIIKFKNNEDPIVMIALWYLQGLDKEDDSMDSALRDIMKQDQQDTFTFTTNAPREVLDNVAHWAETLLQCDPPEKAQRAAGFIKFLGYDVRISPKNNTNSQ